MLARKKLILVSIFPNQRLKLVRKTLFIAQMLQNRRHKAVTELVCIPVNIFVFLFEFINI